MIVMNFSNSQKQKIVKLVEIKLSTDFSLLFHQLLNLETDVLETIDIVIELSSDDILRYYGVDFEDSEERSQLQVLIRSLIDFYQSTEDIKLIRKEFKNIKEQIIEDDTLLEEFIFLYGENLELEDYESFDDNFSFKIFDENVELFKK